MMRMCTSAWSLFEFVCVDKARWEDGTIFRGDGGGGVCVPVVVDDVRLSSVMLSGLTSHPLSCSLTCSLYINAHLLCWSQR
jgi:hypothetical protein